MYKAAKTFNQQSRLISAYDGKVWRNRYSVKVLTEFVSRFLINHRHFVTVILE